jgi:EAL domain-containing protein (putative c-di-GMP-specific phosphodiesterase class I)/AmiR/NasT family two-component response regulator
MEPPSRAISVILADDEPHIVEYLRMVLHLEGFDVTGTATDADGVVQLADHLHPDVALLDLRMPGGGLEAARLIGSVSPATRIVVFSADADAPEILPLLRAGIDGYVVKGAPPERLADAIRSAVSGGTYFAPAVSRAAMDELTARLHVEEQDMLRRNRVVDRVRDVIAGARFQVVYQPIVDLRTGAPRGVEALTRFTATPLRPPEAWFDEAEQAGLRTSLELATACVALGALDQLRPELDMTVNISPATALSGRLGEILLGLDLGRVVLELTEHAPVTDYPALTAALAPWRQAGARIAVDDAGGGYASFAHILSLSPEFIKLDISLVRNIHIDRQRQALTRAITGFASELGVTVVAEGIETEAELDVVTGLGTALAQGFHLGRPRPLEEQPGLLSDAAADLHAAREAPSRMDLRDEPATRTSERPQIH